MTKKTYSDKLLDPKWQKKRLEILDRDNFCCQMCYNDTDTLHVHHRHYIKGVEPWEYPNEYLVTLFKTCHEDESKILNKIVDEFIAVVKTKFFAVDIAELTTTFKNIESGYSSLCLAESIHHFLSNTDNVNKIENDYVKWRDVKYKPDTLFK